jgi:anaerobic selenocysteine-containing dehydrogenase
MSGVSAGDPSLLGGDYRYMVEFRHYDDEFQRTVTLGVLFLNADSIDDAIEKASTTNPSWKSLATGIKAVQI